MYPLNLSVLLGVSLVFLGSALTLLKIYGGLARVCCYLRKWAQVDGRESKRDLLVYVQKRRKLEVHYIEIC